MKNIDKIKTKELNYKNVFVITEKGNDQNYYAYYNTPPILECPVCHNDHIKNNGHGVRKIRDYILLPNGDFKYVTIHLRYDKYLCLTASCKANIFPIMPFVKKLSRVSLRLEKRIIKCSLFMPFVYVPLYVGGTVTDAGSKKILRRWLNSYYHKEIITEVPILAVRSVLICGEYRLMLFQLTKTDVFLIDVLEDIYLETIKAKFNSLDKVQYILLDTTLGADECAAQCFPKAKSIFNQYYILEAVNEYSSLNKNDKNSTRRLKDFINQNNLDGLKEWISESKNINPALLILIDRLKKYMDSQSDLNLTYYMDYEPLIEEMIYYAKKSYGCAFELIRARLLYSMDLESKEQPMEISHDNVFLRQESAYSEPDMGVNVRRLLNYLRREDREFYEFTNKKGKNVK